MSGGVLALQEVDVQDEQPGVCKPLIPRVWSPEMV